MDIRVGDTLVMKKNHPCGDSRFLVLRTGMDFRIRCLGCGREVMVPPPESGEKYKIHFSFRGGTQMILPQDKQMHLQIAPGDVGQYCFLPGDPGRCQAIAAHFTSPSLTAQNREFTIYTGRLDGVMVSVCSTGIGGPGAAIAVEELIRCGVHTLVRIGTCGGIDLAVKGGDAVIATGAVRQEGLTRQYVPIEFPAIAHPDVVSALRQASLEQGLPHHTGIVQSKDSFYGQHSPETMPAEQELKYLWQAWKRSGVLASEMESAAIFIVSHLRHARAGAIYQVLWNQEREASKMDNPVVTDTGPVILAAVSAMRKLISGDKQI